MNHSVIEKNQLNKQIHSEIRPDFNSKEHFRTDKTDIYRVYVYIKIGNNNNKKKINNKKTKDK